MGKYETDGWMDGFGYRALGFGIGLDWIAGSEAGNVQLGTYGNKW